MKWVYASLAILIAARSLSWGNDKTHDQITKRIIDDSAAHGTVSVFLQRELALPSGLAEPLVVQLGLDPRVDNDLRPYPSAPEVGPRTYQSWSTFPRAYPLAPVGARLQPNASFCGTSPDRAECIERLATARIGIEGRHEVGRLIRVGVWAEDNPNPRSRHHFYDTERSRLTGRGLDNGKVLEIPALRSITEWFTRKYRGGDPETDENFAYVGRSALDRALGGESAVSNDTPVNVFSLADAEEYLFRGLTAEFPDQRSGFLALHFVALGHALHVLEDMSSPPHVRNDFFEEHLLGALGHGVEDKGEPLGREDFTTGVLKRSPSPPEIDAAGFDVSDFFMRSAVASPRDDSGSPGLAEYVHDRFVSKGSHATTSAFSWFQAYSRPNLPSCFQLGDSTGSGADRIEVRDLPDLELETGLAVENSTQRYIVRGGRRLVACRMHDVAVEDLTIENGDSDPTTWNDGVRRDTYEVLWPLAVAYGREFLEFYYQPRLQVVRTGPRTFKLANPTMLPLEIPIQGLSLVYGTRDEETGLERRVTRILDGCGTGDAIALPATAPGALGELSDVECVLPLALAEKPIDRTQFWIVARGRHGERDDVVAFDRVTAEIYYERGGSEAGWTDATDQRDLAVLSFGIPDTVDATPRVSIDTNLTAMLRRGPNAVSADVDFYAPSIDAAGTRIAVSSDSRLEAGEVGTPGQDGRNFPIASELTLFDIGAWLAPRQLLAPPNQVPLCDYDCPPVWDPISPNRLFFNTRSIFTSLVAKQLAVADAASGSVQSAPLPVQVTSAHGDRLVGLSESPTGPGTPVLIDAATRSRTHVFDLAALRVVACIPGASDPCDSVPPNERWAADLRFAPDGQSVVMALFDDPELEAGALTRHAGDLFVADLATRVIRPALLWNGRAAYPTYSPDGDWIAFHSDAVGPDEGHTFVVSTVDGRVRQVSATAAARYESAWAPGLALPE